MEILKNIGLGLLGYIAFYLVVFFLLYLYATIREKIPVGQKRFVNYPLFLEEIVIIPTALLASFLLLVLSLIIPFAALAYSTVHLIKIIKIGESSRKPLI